MNIYDIGNEKNLKENELLYKEMYQKRRGELAYKKLADGETITKKELLELHRYYEIDKAKLTEYINENWYYKGKSKRPMEIYYMYKIFGKNNRTMPRKYLPFLKEYILKDCGNKGRVVKNVESRYRSQMDKVLYVFEELFPQSTHDSLSDCCNKIKSKSKEEIKLAECKYEKMIQTIQEEFLKFESFEGMLERIILELPDEVVQVLVKDVKVFISDITMTQWERLENLSKCSSKKLHKIREKSLHSKCSKVDMWKNVLEKKCIFKIDFEDEGIYTKEEKQRDVKRIIQQIHVGESNFIEEKLRILSKVNKEVWETFCVVEIFDLYIF